MSRGQIGVYSYSQLVSYFIIGYTIRAFVFSTRTADLGGDIQNGNLSSLLIKPVNIINYYLSRDIADKLLNIAFMAFEFTGVLLIFRPSIVIPSGGQLLIFLISLVIAICLFFFYSLIISYLAFWTDSAWPPRFLFGMVFVNLFSGQFIPLDLLPTGILKVLNFTPYPYLYYYPVKIWLGQLDLATSYQKILISFVVLLITYVFGCLLWTNGQRKYQSYGN